jgi:hypothetical protein
MNGTSGGSLTPPFGGWFEFYGQRSHGLRRGLHPYARFAG